MNLAGTGAQQVRGLAMSEIHRRRTLTSPTVQILMSFHLSGMITDHRRNLGRVGKIETLQICPRSSQTIGDIYDFEFSLRLVFTSDGVVVGVVIRSEERYDLVKIEPTESEAEYRVR